MSAEHGPVPCAAEVSIRGREALEAQGWVRRTVSDRRRVDELVETYRAIGFETRVVGLDPASFGEACNSCALAACGDSLAIFVRRAGA